MCERESSPELRQDPLTGLWVIISPNRSHRPIERETSPLSVEKKECPFCPGNESQTPPEIDAFREKNSLPDQPGWHVRVVPNKYPALNETSQILKSQNLLYNSIPGDGVHEVVIETPDHNSELFSLQVSELVSILKVFSRRLQQIRKNRKLKYALIFKNAGRKAGASLNHPHSQIIATPVLPTKAKIEIQKLKQYYRNNKSCLYCDVIKSEKRQGARVVAESDEFIAYTPFASRFPFETWMISQRHVSRFEMESEDRLHNFAMMLKRVMTKLNRAVGLDAYNFLIHTAPLVAKNDHYFHWHAEILPMMTSVAGFERGAGFYINEIFPELAAQKIREAN